MHIKITKELAPYFKGFNTSGEVILLFVYMKFRFSLSYRDLEEMMTIRGSTIDHSTVQRWVIKFSKLVETKVKRSKRSPNSSWRMDETYIKVNGNWMYLYRAVDKYGDTVNFLLRDKRDGIAAKAFFRKAFIETGIPDKINVDKSGSNKHALDYFNDSLPIDWKYEIRQVKYLNNICEQDHRFIKKRTKPTLGFKSFKSAEATIAGIESIRMIQKGQIIRQHKSQNTYNNFVNLMNSHA